MFWNWILTVLGIVLVFGAIVMVVKLPKWWKLTSVIVLGIAYLLLRANGPQVVASIVVDQIAIKSSSDNPSGALPTLAPAASLDAGHTWFGACDSVNKDPSITALKNNGTVVPNAYMFLDKNETQVAAGDYWFITVPANVYGQVFYPMSGLTYQVRGPAKLRVSAATFWCDNGGSTPHNGQYQMIDAKRIDAKYLDKNWELAGEVVIGDWVTVPGIENQPK